MNRPGLQKFGGSWTDQKLEVLHKYLHAYTQALKRQPFHLLYIDAFAGTGYREIGQNENDSQIELIEQDHDAQTFLDGSARISLQLERPFDRYLFIEHDTVKCEQLSLMAEEFSDIKGRIACRNDDCNLVLKDYCTTLSKKSWRAVLFLDPFGMNAQWETLKTIAETELIDVWILFPLGSAVNRLLMRDGDRIPEAWSKRLDDIFGTNEWFERFYTREISEDLFEQQERTKKTGNLKAIAEFYLERLKTIFPAVAETPKMMYNSRRNPIFMLCFAMGNPADKAQKLALNIANNILKKV